MDEQSSARVALPEAVKNARQSDTILENSPKGDGQSNGAAEISLRRTEAMIRTWKVFMPDEMNVVIDTCCPFGWYHTRSGHHPIHETS